MKDSRYAPSPEGEAMRELRVRADLTQTETCRLMGVSRGYLAIAENGQLRPSPRVIRKFATALKLSLAEEQRLLALRAQKWAQPVLSPRATDRLIRRAKRAIRRLTPEEKEHLGWVLDDVILIDSPEFQESLAQLQRGETVVLREMPSTEETHGKEE